MTAELLAQSSAILSQDSSILSAIDDPKYNIVIWQRPRLPFDAASFITDTSQSIQLIVSAQGPEAPLRKALDDHGFVDHAGRDDLISDIINLCAAFQPIANTSHIEIRLKIIEDDACYKFHADYVSARLITTYVGPGTQWLEQHDADRVADSLEPIEIKEVAAGDVAIFKGKSSTVTPAIQRTPPIKGSGQYRLMLVLNPHNIHVEI